MEGEYPIKPYKKPKGTITLHHTITGKNGKVIEFFGDQANPEIVTFYIKNNRGTLKDTIEISIEDARNLVTTITGWDKLLPKEE